MQGFPAPVRIGVTFAVVLVTWVFFRAADLGHAFRYLGIHGRDWAGPAESAGLLAGIVYQPYYLGTFLLAGLIVWSAPQTWDWSRTLDAAESGGGHGGLCAVGGRAGHTVV